ncbi:L,D-transpeptidase [Hasllibacter halocynthiae]|nr:L,D-transpeptidase [Hasllibacter halocynthiae]
MQRRSFMGAAAAALGAVPMGLAPFGAGAQELPDQFLPRMVRTRAGFEANEIHVDPGQFALYWTLPNAQAIRYSVGIGRPGLYEAGEFYVGAKREWPSWTPTPDMIERDPASYAQYADGMPGGPENPLGARAIYLFTPSRGDTFLRIHGTNAPRTIGTAVSNGCARLVNPHAVDLYDRVPLNSRVVLYPQV